MSFKPMLAGKYADTDPFRAVLMSLKLDGIRCLGLDSDIKSRTLKPIPNDYIRGILAGPELDGLDGELIVGEAFAPDVYRTTDSFVMSPDKVGGDFHYWVFDITDADWAARPFYERFAELCRRVQELPEETQRFIRITEQRPCNNIEELLAYEEEMLDVGFEGVMLRDPYGRYKHGRCGKREPFLLKLKRFEDAEARVVGYEEEQANNNEATKDALGRTKRSSAQAGKTGKGILGKLLCETLDGEHFKAGIPFACSGFTADLKAELWEIRDTLPGRFITYKHFARGIKDAPRHPNFKGFRSPIDMGEPA